MALDRLSQVTSSGISSTVNFRAQGITVSGIVTASSFVGDGSGLIGVVGSGSGVVIKDDNATVGTAATINFGSNLSVSAISAGIVTVTATDTNTTYTQAAVADGSNVNLRLSGSDSTTDDILLTAGTNITFSSVTAGGFTINSSGGSSSVAGIDTTGTSTFTNLNVTGVSTFAGITTVTGSTLFAKQLNVSGVVTATSFSGSGINLTGIVTSIASGSGISIDQSTGKVTITATGGSGSIAGIDTTGTSTFTNLNVTGVSTFAGITTVTGTTLFAKQLNVSGVVTASSFSGSASDLTGIPAGQLTGALPAIDGSALTNVIGSGSGVIVRDSGTLVGTAGTIDFGDNLTVSAIVAGIVTVTGSAGGGSIAGIDTTGTSTFTNLNVTGVSTFAGITTVTGPTLFAKQLNVSGVVTATTFIGAVTGNVTGNATGLSGTPNITVGTIAATSLNASGIVTATSFRSTTTTGDGTDIGFALKYYITSSGSSAYRLAGPGVLNSTDNPTLYLHRGFTYIFENSTGGSHPFAFRTSSGGSAYTSSFLSGSQTGTQIFTVPFDAPNTLVYQCTIHSAMVGTLNIVT